MNYLTDGPASSKHIFLFAHGAGGPMDHPWMTRVARAMGEHGVRVVRFEFPYMAARREGKKRGGAPDRPPVLLETWRRVIEEHGGGSKVFIGGKSMGGRIASMVADDAQVRGLICFGYPFHPPGKLDQPRTAHLEKLRTPALILQGTRDPFGTQDQVSTYVLSKAIRIEWLPDGDHSLVTRKKGVDNLGKAVDSAVSFMTGKP